MADGTPRAKPGPAKTKVNAREARRADWRTDAEKAADAAKFDYMDFPRG
jgi:hypothetical protein